LDHADEEEEAKARKGQHSAKSSDMSIPKVWG
jgi:hypothetical protein